MVVKARGMCNLLTIDAPDNVVASVCAPASQTRGTQPHSRRIEGQFTFAANEHWAHVKCEGGVRGGSDRRR